MGNQKLTSGQTLSNAGQSVDNFWYISSGKIQATFDGGSFSLVAGNLIGIVDFAMDGHYLTYTALEDTQLISYGNQAMLQNPDFFKNHPDNTTHLAVSLNNQMLELLSLYDVTKYRCHTLYNYIKDTYKKYSDFSNEYHVVAKELPALSSISPLLLEQDIGHWIPTYYAGMKSLFSDAAMREKLEKASVLPAYLYQTSETFHQVLQLCEIMQDYCSELGQLLLNEEQLDLFDLLTALFYRVANHPKAKSQLEPFIGEMAIMMENQPGIASALLQMRLSEYHKRIQSMENLRQLSESGEVTSTSSTHATQELSNATQIILEYAECLPEFSSSFQTHLAEYKQLSDKNSSTPEAIDLRKKLTEEFYQLYTNAFQNSLLDNNIPIVLKMFFYFGFVDAELSGMNNALYLHENANICLDMPEHGIYSMYSWLRAIYSGEVEPSITELDSDYERYVQDLINSNKINRTVAAKMLDDTSQKVMFELSHFFPTACKVTNGHISSFCPLLSEHQIIRPLSDTILHTDTILEALEHLCSVDYSLFYRDSMTIISEKENIHDYFHVEIRPQIILTPLVGIRGSMWQEVSGRNPLTPARMLLPIFELENLDKILLHMCGEYRWAICKRTHGAHWNDVSDPSLTSLYFDYLQFFKRNNDLSSDAKNKVKIQLGKCKQNFKEYFIQDYIIYMQYEANGSPRLNKLARSILFSECPFSSPIRNVLGGNPLYTEALDRRRLRVAQRLHFLNNMKTKLENLRRPIPDSLLKEIEYYNK